MDNKGASQGKGWFLKVFGKRKTEKDESEQEEEEPPERIRFEDTSVSETSEKTTVSGSSEKTTDILQKKIEKYKQEKDKSEQEKGVCLEILSELEKRLGAPVLGA